MLRGEDHVLLGLAAPGRHVQLLERHLLDDSPRRRLVQHDVLALLRLD